MAKRNEEVKMARPGEPEAVRTTIVGGRPSGRGQDVGDIPRGVEVLVKKASVDPKFKKLLLEKRAAAAAEIALQLDPVEEAMLSAVPEAQLGAIIASTKVNPKLRSVFLGCAAALMLAAITAGAGGCKRAADNEPPPYPAPTGINPDIPESVETAGTAEEPAEEAETGAAEEDNGPEVAGIRPDLPPPSGD